MEDRSISATLAAGDRTISVPFPFQLTSELAVHRTRDSATVLLALDTDYSVSGVTVTLASDALEGDVIVVDGNTEITRISDYDPSQTPTGDQIDADLDRLTWIGQETRRDLDKTRADLDAIVPTLTAESAANVALAQAAAAAAAVSETNANDSATAAAADKTAADGSAAAAAASASDAHDFQLLAEAAKDGALVNGGFYNDEPTGRAAVADGAFFKVAGAVGGDEAAKIYRRQNAGASEQRPSMASYEYIASLVTLLRPDSALRVGTDMAALLKRKTGYLWVANDRYSVFSDAAGTTLANVGDYCPLWKDLSGRSNHFTKHASYNAPVLREDARGVRYFEFVGSSEDRTLKAAAGGNTAVMFGGFAIRVQSAAGTVRQVLVASDAATNGWVLGQNNTGTRFETRNAGGSTIVTDNVANITPAYEAAKVGEILVSSGGFDGTRAFKWKNGLRRMSVPAGYTQKASGEVWLGHNIQDSSGETITHLYATCLFTENLTFPEQQIVNAYLASLVPIHGRATNVLSLAKNKIELGTGDTTIAMFSDSTMDAEEEGFYPLATFLAGLYPAFTVEYTSADYTNNTMFATVTINTGTNGRKIRLFNFAQSGGVGRRYFADRYSLVTALGNIDLAIFNIGKNIAASNADEVVRGEFLAPIEQLRATYPGVGVAAIMQPPNMLNDDEDAIYRVLNGIMADWREFYLIKAADAWKARGRRQSDYQDPGTNAIHPNNVDPFFGNGSGITTNVFKEEYNVASVIAGTVGARMLATTTAGLLQNPKFASWAGAMADDWIIGSGTVSKDTVNFAAGNTYSMLIVGAGSYVYQDLDATAITSFTVFGKTMASSADVDSGAIEIQWLDASNALVGTSISSTGDGGSGTGGHAGAFCNTMICGSPKPAGATKLRVRLRGGPTGGRFNDISTCAGNKPMSLV